MRCVFVIQPLSKELDVGNRDLPVVTSVIE